MIAWMIAAFFFVVCLALSWRVVRLEEDLFAEKRLRGEALDHERKLLDHIDQIHRRYVRTVEINHQLAQQRTISFAGQPTLDATAYRAEGNPRIVWWTYDN